MRYQTMLRMRVRAVQKANLYVTPQNTHQVCGTVPHCRIGDAESCLYDNSCESGVGLGDDGPIG